MSNTTVSIHETFNARNLTTKELCDSFIISDYFSELASANHSIMIGPRGSGKTTLMRMLQVEALELWDYEQAGQYRHEISFSGVFIPTDRFWKKQSDSLKERLHDTSVVKQVIQSSFVYHILEKISETVLYRTCYAIETSNRYQLCEISKVTEAELVDELAMSWKVTPRIKSLRSLVAAITHKKKEISDFSVALLQSTQATQPQAIEGDISSILGTSINLINTFLKEPDHKWTLLFDELELAPDDIIQPLIDAMRGGPEHLILKLSLSPYHKNLKVTCSPDSSMKNQDLSFINLTGASDNNGTVFAETLCKRVFSKYGLNGDVSSYFDSAPDIDEMQVFSELSEKDFSFKEYLEHQKIDIKEISNYSEHDKRPTIRKVKFIADIRNFYTKNDPKTGHLVGASRKTFYPGHGGFENLCKALEYNPRMLIGLMSQLADIVKSPENIISISDQLSYLNEFYNSYQSLLRTINIDTPKHNNMFDLIKDIAESIRDFYIFGDKFEAEPKGTLRFTKAENIDYLDAIGWALNAGALIMDKESENAFHNSHDVSAIKCRLSYIFSHEFRLLMTKPRGVDLSELIDKKSGNKKNEQVKKTQLNLEL